MIHVLYVICTQCVLLFLLFVIKKTFFIYKHHMFTQVRIYYYLNFIKHYHVEKYYSKSLYLS